MSEPRPSGAKPAATAAAEPPLLPPGTFSVERGVRVKATGFGRVDFDVREALAAIYAANPKALMFGTDLPCTRAPRPYRDDDLRLVVETLGEKGAAKVLCENAIAFYAPRALRR